jgi:hypothetical protein
MSKNKETRYAYMDKVDFEHELGEAVGGNTLYSSVKDLLNNQKCITECGVVKVKITIEEVILGSKYRMTEEEKEERKKILESYKK